MQLTNIQKQILIACSAVTVIALVYGLSTRLSFEITIELFITLAFIIGVYFLPYIAALAAKRKNKHQIGAVNLLAGWTGIGWIACMLWAAIDLESKQKTDQK